MSISRGMDKEGMCVCTYTMEYYSAIKNNEILLLETWMDLEDIMLCEISQIEKYKYHMVSRMCGILKYIQQAK